MESIPDVMTTETDLPEIDEDVSSPFDKFDATPYLLIVGCLGVLDNGFVIVVVIFYTSMTKRLTGRLILNQSCVDLVASLVVVVRQSNSLVRANKVPFDGITGELYCRLWVTGSIQWVFILASTVNLMAITIERYISVVFPIYHNQNCSKTVAIPVIVFVWLFGAVFEIGWCAPSSEAFGERCVMMTFGGNDDMWMSYGVTSVVFYYFLPISCMFLCYSHMAYALRHRIRKVRPTGDPVTLNNIQLSSAQRNLFKTMFMVSASFVTCWTWYEVVWFSISVGIGPNNMYDVLQYSHLIALVNLVINPFIYIIHYKEFRKGLQSMRQRFAVRERHETSLNRLTQRTDGTGTVTRK